MKLLRKVLRIFGISEELTLFEIIVTGIAVIVVALIYLSFVASLLVFHHWSVTTMECLLLVYVGLEIKMYRLLRKKSVKLLRMNDNIEQMYYHNHLHYHHQDYESKVGLSTLYFLISSISFESIHIYFYMSTKNDLIKNILSVRGCLPLFYINVIITNLFASTIFMISMFVCFQKRSLFFNLYIEKFKNESFHLFIKEDMESFKNFYVSNKFSFISYIEPLEKLNTACLVCYNLYLIFVVLTINTFNRKIMEMFSILMSIIILNSYYVLNYFIMIKNRRKTRFILSCIDSIIKFIEIST